MGQNLKYQHKSMNKIELVLQILEFSLIILEHVSQTYVKI